jgi:Predicted membrane protein (DUF2306)
MSRTLTVPPAVGRLPGRATPLGLGFVAAVGLVFVVVAAVPYLRLTPEQFRGYWPRRWWLLLHVVTGMVALVSGPLQLWLGLARRRVPLHRVLGIVYLASVAVSATAAYYLALHTDFGWVFGAGLAGLATAWVVTTGLAFVAVRRRLYDQHKEWMIRSYVVTTGFISFRLLFAVLGATGVGTLTERLAACSWFCWAIPLLVAEAILQGRKMFGPD